LGYLGPCFPFRKLKNPKKNWTAPLDQNQQNQLLTAPLAAAAFVANNVSTAAPRASRTLAANGGTSTEIFNI
jgi:hypothetical protein